MENNISYTIQNELCVGCGICIDVCPHAAISMTVRDGRFIPFIDTDLCYNNKGCHRCMDACPGKAVSNCVLDARRCISYQTIESRRSFRDEEFPVDRKGWIFGCDECIQACPWYRRGGDGDRRPLQHLP